MVKLVCLVRRKPGVGVEEFHRHWRDVHGPLVAGTEMAKYVLRYEQHHRLASDYERADTPWDGAAVMWFATADDYWSFVAHPDYASTVHPDEQQFLDTDHLVWMLTEEPNVFVDRLGAAATP